jgi:dienelactone hydrolase
MRVVEVESGSPVGVTEILRQQVLRSCRQCVRWAARRPYGSIGKMGRCWVARIPARTDARPDIRLRPVFLEH